jgi:acetyltransferase-like isoleucine patch superfamily enzyme
MVLNIHDQSVAQTRFKKVGNSNITIGRYTYGFENISILQWGEAAGLDVGGFCSIAANITIFLGGNHKTDWITTFPFGHIFAADLGGEDITGHPATNGNVVIGNDVWIGYSATIMSGISLGDGAVVAANSHVVKNVEAYEIVGGNPAKHIKFRFSDEIRALLLHLRWWDLSINEIKGIVNALSTKPSVDSLSALITQFNR